MKKSSRAQAPSALFVPLDWTDQELREFAEHVQDLHRSGVGRRDAAAQARHLIGQRGDLRRPRRWRAA